MIAILNIIYQASMPLDQSSGLQLTKFEITNVGHIDVSVSGKDSIRLEYSKYYRNTF